MNNDKSELLEQLLRLEWLLRYRHMQTHRERGPMGDPHRGQGRILALLRLQPEISQKALSAILDIRSQSLGELLAKLERLGFITRSPSATDHRAVDIRLTEAGKIASEQGAESADSDSLFGCLSEEEQEALGGYLGRLIVAWEGQLAAEGAEAGPRQGPDWGGRGLGRRGGFPGPGPAHGFGRGPGGDPRRRHFKGRDFGGRASPDEE